MKNKLNAEDNLRLNKPLKLHLLAIIVRCIFAEHIIFCRQVYFDECLYELKTVIQLHQIEGSKGIDLNKTNKEK